MDARDVSRPSVPELQQQTGDYPPSVWRAVRKRVMSPARLPVQIPEWFLRPEFLALLLVGAILRLALPLDASFLSDQSQMLIIGQSAVAHGALPVTGIRSSIGTLNPPASIFLLLPFAVLGNPLWATIATALSNVAALVVLYALANRYAGRWAAFTAGALYATAAWPTYFSRFIWQQNMLALVVVLFLWTACRGAIERKPGWLGWNVLLWGIAAQLHPTALPLLALTGVTALLAWRTIRLRDLGWAALALVVLWGPTLIWELVSGWSDVPIYRAYLQQPSRVDHEAVTILESMLAPQKAYVFGPGSLYARIYHDIAWLVPLVHLLFVFGEVWLVIALLWQGWRALAQWRRLHDLPKLPALGLPDWRFLLLLLLWQAAPLALMIKHSSPIHQHYLLEVLPAPFLVIGIALGWLMTEAIPGTVAWLRDTTWPVRQVSSAVLALFVMVVAIGQSAGVTAELETIHRGHFDGTERSTYTRYGIPLGGQEAAVNATLSAAAKYRARPVFATSWLHQQSIGYLAALGNSASTSYDAENCLLVPAAGSQPAVTLMLPGMTSSGLLPRLSGTSHLAEIPVQGSRPLELYRVQPGAHLPGEIASPAASSGSPSIAAYMLDRGSSGPTRLVLRWQGTPSTQTTPATRLLYWYGRSPSSSAPPVGEYTFIVQPLDAAGQTLGSAQTICRWLAWPRGMNLYTWITVPNTHGQAVASWRVSVMRQVYEAPVVSAGPIPLESGQVVPGPAEPVGTPVTIPAHP